MSEVAELAQLATAAYGLGHIDLEIDPDGIFRRTSLYKRTGTQWRPHFALALAGAPASTQPLQLQNTTDQQNEQCVSDPRHSPSALIAYGGASGHIPSLPCINVLRGEVPPVFFMGGMR